MPYHHLQQGACDGLFRTMNESQIEPAISTLSVTLLKYIFFSTDIVVRSYLKTFLQKLCPILWYHSYFFTTNTYTYFYEDFEVFHYGRILQELTGLLTYTTSLVGKYNCTNRNWSWLCITTFNVDPSVSNTLYCQARRERGPEWIQNYSGLIIYWEY